MGDEEYISTKTARKILGVTTPTLSTWAKKGKVGFVVSPSGKKLYSKKDIFSIAGRDPVEEKKKKVCYCRVSSKKQMDDLGRQVHFLNKQFPDHEMVTDVGSGINWKRKGLQTILEQSMRGEISEVVVAHRDRLCRFGFELIEFILNKSGTELHVLDEDSEKSPDRDLAEDLVSIIHVYSCRNMGRPRYKNKGKTTEPVHEGEDLPIKTPENCVQEVVRDE